MKTRTYYRVLLSVALGFSAAFLCSAQTETMKQLGKLSQTMYYIDQLYLEDVDMKDLVEKAIVSTMAELDPHSSFISAEDVKAMNEPLEGEFEGIGIEFAIIRDTLTVQGVVAGGPSEKVGLLAGDKILVIDGKSFAGRSLANDDVFKALRGEKGTKVLLEIRRGGVKENLHFTVVRDRIPINSIDAVYEAAPGVLYVKLSRFAAKSHEELLSAVKGFGKEIRGMIVDLRANTGGFLPVAIDIANEFLAPGDLIVYTEGRSFPRLEESAKGNGIYENGPLAVLVDENSASASEILSGAIQDQDRGVIVGRRTFGKGLVQQAIPLQDGSQLRLTVARYHTPSGRVIQSPYESGNAEKYYMDFYERYARGESFSRDSIHFPDSLRYSTLKKGRTVYGGGGIMPDVFVPTDTMSYTPYYASLLRQGLVIEYMNGLCDRNRSRWTSRYADFDSFRRRFVITDEMVGELTDLASGRGIPLVKEELKRSEKDLKRYMKALAASAIVSRDSFYRIINEGNPEYEKALEIIDSWH